MTTDEWEVTLTDDPDVRAEYAARMSSAFAIVIRRLASTNEEGQFVVAPGRAPTNVGGEG